MKSKIVRGIINGGVLAAVAALGITVYQLGTKPIVENSQEENSVQMEEELSDGENAEDAAVTGNGWEDVAQDEMTDGAAGDETGLSGASENGADADGVTGSIRETAGSGAAENEGTAGTDGNTMADVNNGSGAENKSVSAAAGAESAGNSTAGIGNAADNANAGNAANNGAETSSADTAETSAAGIAAQTLNFTEDSIMEWPVRGTVLVDYNMNETVYYPTLDQYQVSPAISLQSSGRCTSVCGGRWSGAFHYTGCLHRNDCDHGAWKWLSGGVRTAEGSYSGRR